MNDIIINQIRPVVAGAVAPFDYCKSRTENNKNISLDSALRIYAGSCIEPALLNMVSILDPKRKHVLVDVKFHELEVGDIPCIPGWHIDGGPDIPSEYVLCVAGSSMTEFNTDIASFEYDSNTKRFCKNMNSIIGDNPSFNAEPWQVIKYNNLNPHRGAVAKVSGQRLLLRVMCSDHIKPNVPGKWSPSKYRS